MNIIHNESSNESSDIDTKSLKSGKPTPAHTQININLSDVEDK